MNANDNTQSDKTTTTITPAFAAILFWLVLTVSILSDTYLSQVITDKYWYRSVSTVLLRGLIGLWIHADSRSRGWAKERTTWYFCFAMLFTGITTLVYLVKSRGWKGAFRSSCRFFLYLLGFMAVCLFLEAIASYSGLVVNA